MEYPEIHISELTKFELTKLKSFLTNYLIQNDQIGEDIHQSEIAEYWLKKHEDIPFLLKRTDEYKLNNKVSYYKILNN